MEEGALIGIWRRGDSISKRNMICSGSLSRCVAHACSMGGKYLWARTESSNRLEQSQVPGKFACHTEPNSNIVASNLFLQVKNVMGCERGRI